MSAVTKRASLHLPPNIPLDEWRQIGRQIFVVSDSSAWWLGDWLIYGQAEYPDRYKRAVTETQLDYQTLRNYAWVARRYPESRRRSSLSFQHHAELTSLSDAQQDEWLERAEKFSWSRNELRNRVKASRNANEDREVGKRNMLAHLPANKQERWLNAAAMAQQDLFTWVVSVLDDAASVALEAQPEY